MVNTQKKFKKLFLTSNQSRRIVLKMSSSSTVKRQLESGDDCNSVPDIKRQCKEENQSADFNLLSDVESIFKDMQNDAIVKSGNAEDFIEDTITFLTAAEFKNTNLNVATEEQPYSKFTLEESQFSEFLDDTPFLGGKPLHKAIEPMPLEKKYLIVYLLLVKKYKEILSDEDCKLVLLILKVFNDRKEKFQNCVFIKRFDEILCKKRVMIDTKKVDNNLRLLLGCDEDVNSSDLQKRHFETEPVLYENVMAVLKCCSKLQNICSASNIRYSRLKGVDYTVPNGGSVAEEIKVKPTLVLTLAKPVMLRVTITTLPSLNVKAMQVDPEQSEIIRTKLQEILYFKASNGKRAEIPIYNNIGIGEMRNMGVINMSDDSKPHISKNIGKDKIENMKEAHILVNEFLLHYNDNNDKLGCAMRCWPMKHKTKDQYGTEMDVQLLDFEVDERNEDIVN
ncbi:hypothetical protein PvNV_010 [Penaeus vannamei nudivirus]|nr:hypothetical protein PvSNPV_010 [Penaeus vannamei nucleopolyhedrovirus]